MLFEKEIYFVTKKTIKSYLTIYGRKSITWHKMILDTKIKKAITDIIRPENYKHSDIITVTKLK